MYQYMLQKMPTLFVGHGNPMNALWSNEYTEAWRKLGASVQSEVRAVLILSAHWATRGGLAVTTAERPGVLYDFYGFPDELFQVQYDAPGEPELARHLQQRFAARGVPVHADDERPLDHGAWSILVHMFPDANIPCVQLSYDMHAGGAAQWELGQTLIADLSAELANETHAKFNGRSLREQGVLSLASGNIVHNLRTIDFSSEAPALPWAVEFDEQVRQVLNGPRENLESLIEPGKLGEAARLSVPTPDHYIPFVNFLGTIGADDALDYPCEGIQNASISMRTVRAAG